MSIRSIPPHERAAKYPARELVRHRKKRKRIAPICGIPAGQKALFGGFLDFLRNI
jgi:hypothetical protein